MPEVNNKQNPVYIDHLDEDDPIPRQKYVCLSFITPEKVKGAKNSMVKIRGVYETMEEANQRCHQLSKEDPIFDVFVGEVGKWGLVTNDPDKAQDVNYYENELQQLAKGYKENMANAKNIEKQRKLDLLRTGDYDTTESSRNKKNSDVANRLKKKLEEKKLKMKLLEETKHKLEKGDIKSLIEEHSQKLEQLNSELKEKEEDVKEKKLLSQEESKRLRDTSNLVQEKEKEVKEVDKNIKKIQKLYEKLKQKQAHQKN